ncbi:MAG: LON peptidase substrate-binding domain-containing protein [Thalassobaculales bacterium]
MSAASFTPAFEDLPAAIPIFPLEGVLLLPRGRLPLNIFEPRYLEMTRAALAAPQRLIGMIQPRPGSSGREPPVFETGCAGRITSFSETDDGRYLITLTGVCRFTVAQELPGVAGYRIVQPDWSRFRADFDAPGAVDFDRPRFEAALKRYFTAHGIQADWEAVTQSPEERLITSLAMICPFSPLEKQALLEAPDLAARAEAMTALVEMAVAELPGGDGAKH